MSEKASARRESRNDREYFRVHTVLPLRQQEVSRREMESFREKLGKGPSESEREEKLSVEDRLSRIEEQLGHVLALLDPDSPQPLREQDLRLLELSGAGVKYPWPEEVTTGAEVILQFSLPGKPARTVRCAGRVVGCRDPLTQAEPYAVAVAFTHIREADRDAIVRHTLEVQRIGMRAGDPGDIE